MSLEYKIYSLQEAVTVDSFYRHLETVLNGFGEDGWKMVHLEMGLPSGFIVFERFKPSSYSNLKEINPEILAKAKVENHKLS